MPRIKGILVQHTLACCLALLLGACASAPRNTPGDRLPGLGQRLLHDYMQPRTQALRQRTGQLQSALAEYCARPSDGARRAAAEEQFGNVVAAWAQVEFLRFGPLVEQNRADNFFFWPDPRGVVQRQMRSMLAGADASLLQPDQLRQQSAAVQGIPALEYALYADDAARVIAAGEAAGRYRCAFSSAVAENLVRLATQIAAGWSSDAPLAVEFARPAARHAVYRSSGEVATEALKAMSTALHVARDQNLLPALGEDAAASRGTLLPLHRSGLTTRYLAAGTQGLSQFHEAARFGAALGEDKQWIDVGIRDELRRAQEDFAQLQVPATQALADGSHRDLLVHAGLVLANARSMVDEYLAPALDVNLGFNSLDGD
ncbi:MAG: imelysin family protein [Pseudomonadota bacterium]|nr:imelysin family protein [Pseudomonadota bacterium]